MLAPTITDVIPNVAEGSVIHKKRILRLAALAQNESLHKIILWSKNGVAVNISSPHYPQVSPQVKIEKPPIKRGFFGV